jgi:hypothetical protein
MKTSHFNRKSKNRLSFLISLGIICFLNLNAYSLDVMGPPAAELEQGWFNAGIEYTNSKMDLELSNGFYTDYLDGDWFESGSAYDITLKDMKTNRTYVRLGYGIMDNAEVFLRIGGLNAKFGDSIWEDSERFDSDAELAAGAGLKLTFYEEGNLKLGGLFQFNVASFDGQLKASDWVSGDFVEINMSEAQLALGASCKCNEQLTIYGGPFLHFVNGDIHDEYSELSTDPNYPGLWTSEFDWDIQGKSVFGGYVGAQINFAENVSFNLEYQQTADARALGMGLIFKF